MKLNNLNTLNTVIIDAVLQMLAIKKSAKPRPTWRETLHTNRKCPLKCVWAINSVSENDLGDKLKIQRSFTRLIPCHACTERDRLHATLPSRTSCGELRRTLPFVK